VQGLYPRPRVSAGDIGCAFAGVRPLPYSPGADLSGLSRRHSLHDHSAEGAAGVVSVIGGKLTTAASLARECVAMIGVAKTGVANAGVAAPPLQIALADGSHVDDLLERKIAEVAESGNISRDSARGLVEWYGQQSLAIASAARNRPELPAPLCPHTNHMVAEAVHALTQEFAVTLGDVLLRRVPVALGACWSLECSREASWRVGAAMGWGERRTASAWEEFESERESFLRKPAAAARRSSSA
ncbi:MAG: glycerol-3-phosphate dehydrogenase C-terminal domain-containing protein, partial [Terriglobales bacterium]